MEAYQRELDTLRAAQSCGNTAPESSAGTVLLRVEDVFAITSRGTVVVGKCENAFAVGEKVLVVGPTGTRETKITGIEKFRKIVNDAQPGENVGVLLQGLTRADVDRGDMLQRR